MAETQIPQLKGRSIADSEYSGLIESLAAIGLLSQIASQAKDDLSKDDLVTLLGQIGEKAAQGLVLSGAESEEIDAVNDALITSMEADAQPE